MTQEALDLDTKKFCVKINNKYAFELFVKNSFCFKIIKKATMRVLMLCLEGVLAAAMHTNRSVKCVISLSF